MGPVTVTRGRTGVTSRGEELGVHSGPSSGGPVTNVSCRTATTHRVLSPRVHIHSSRRAWGPRLSFFPFHRRRSRGSGRHGHSGHAAGEWRCWGSNRVGRRVPSCPEAPRSLCEEWGWESRVLNRCPTSSGVTLGQSHPPNLASVFIRRGRGSTKCP